MGLTIILRNESGNQQAEPVEDQKNVLSRILQTTENGSYHHLRYIDRYGNTVFNSLQMVPFLEEWQRLRASANTPEEYRVLDATAELARKCGATDHVYLWFVGD